jgi:hypothetical protein
MTDWAKPFPVGSVYRYDLQRIGLTNEQINTLSEVLYHTEHSPTNQIVVRSCQLLLYTTIISLRGEY